VSDLTDRRDQKQCASVYITHLGRAR
jgi:hypothetical protein